MILRYLYVTANFFYNRFIMGCELRSRTTSGRGPHPRCGHLVSVSATLSHQSIHIIGCDVFEFILVKARNQTSFLTMDKLCIAADVKMVKYCILTFYRSYMLPYIANWFRIYAWRLNSPLCRHHDCLKWTRSQINYLAWPQTNA